MLEFEPLKNQGTALTCIKVIGVGGGGGNTLNSMIDARFEGIEFMVANTDAQALTSSKAPIKIQLGVKSTKGLGTGANPELGKRAAEEDLGTLMEHLEDANIVFLTGGLGGGTGSGALPVIARALKEKNILSIAVVTKPFDFEGKKRALVAQEAIEVLKKEVDILLIIPNQKLLNVVDKHVSMKDADGLINAILNQCVKGIYDIIAKPGHINVDFADVRTIMKDMGLAVMGTGKARGADRALIAAQQAISSPLLENMSIKGAQSVLVNISGGNDLALYEISDAAEIITQEAAEHANIIVGCVVDESLHDEIIVTVIATGFLEQELAKKPSNMAFKPATEEMLKDHEIIAPRTVAAGESMQHKTKSQSKEMLENPLRSELINDRNDLDIPTFMRQPEGPSLDE